MLCASTEFISGNMLLKEKPSKLSGLFVLLQELTSKPSHAFRFALPMTSALKVLKKIT